VSRVESSQVVATLLLLLLDHHVLGYLFVQPVTMAEYLAVEKVCVHQVKSVVYAVEHAYSIGPDGLSRLLLQST
jgi:hypothetical protein